MKEFIKEYHQLEYGKGYSAIMVLSILGYIGCSIYGFMGFITLSKSLPAGLLLIFSASLGTVSVYVFNKIGLAVFIVRDIQITKVEENKS